MASLGVLASLFPQYPQTPPVYDPMQSYRLAGAAQGVQRNDTLNRTALLDLAELQRQQEAQQAFYGALQQNPDAILGRAGAQPQSLLGSLQAPARPDPVRALMQQNPRAGLQLMDTQMKLQERQLDRRGKIAGYMGSVLQGVTDQASYDAARDELRRVPGGAEWVARLPPTYSKEAVQPFIDRALSVKEKALLDSENLKTQVEIGKYNLQAAQSGYQGLGDDRIAILKGLTDEQVKEFGGRTSPAAIAYANQEANRVALQKVRETGAAQAGEQPLSDTTAQTVTALRRGESLAHQLLTEFTPEERAKFVGLGGLRMSGQQLQAWLRDATKTGADPRYARFLTLLSEGENEAFATGGKALSKQEADVVFGYIPTGKETSVAEFESKLQQAKDRATTRLDETLKLATTPKRALAGERASGSLARPGSGAATTGTTTGSKGTVKLEVLADYAAKHNIPLNDVIRQTQAKGVVIE